MAGQADADGDRFSTFVLGKNRSGFWEVRWSERDSQTGLWRSRACSCRTKDQREAERFRARWEQEVQGLARQAAEPTVEDLVARYLDSAEARGVGATQKFSLLPVRRYFGSEGLSAINEARLRAYRTSRKVADSTVRRELAALVTVCRWAVRHKIVPADVVPAVDLPPPAQGRLEFLDEGEESLFLALAYGDSIGKPRLSRITRFVAIALDTAARKRAIEGLTWDRVDLVAGLIDFREVGRRVSRKRRVPVPISDRLFPVLARAWIERQDQWVCGQGDIRKAWETWIAKTPFAGRITAHDLRRTWATLAARRGVDLWDVAGVLGDDLTTVTKHYAHHRPDHLRRAVERRT